MHVIDIQAVAAMARGSPGSRRHRRVLLVDSTRTRIYLDITIYSRLVLCMLSERDLSCSLSSAVAEISALRGDAEMVELLVVSGSSRTSNLGTELRIASMTASSSSCLRPSSHDRIRGPVRHQLIYTVHECYNQCLFQCYRPNSSTCLLAFLPTPAAPSPRPLAVSLSLLNSCAEYTLPA